ncbi:hypothetical protein [Scytonema sp. PCC 10023]|uniref:hypothetical protein n=1 Tax=Scytonema sp. PCC 10023 TaxID=1680591 RepID=UPI0039C7480C
MQRFLVRGDRLFTSYQLPVTSYSLFTVLMQYVANNHRIESTIVAKVPTQDSSH